MLLSKDFINARNGKEIFNIEKDFTNQRSLANTEIKLSKKQEKYDSIQSLLVNKKFKEVKLERKYKNIIAAKKSRDNVKHRLILLERLNKELMLENTKLKLRVKSSEDSYSILRFNSPSKISNNSMNISNSYDETTCDNKKSKYVNCVNCGYLNIIYQDGCVIDFSNSSVNNSTVDIGSSLEISSVNNNSLFSAHLSKLSMLIGLICLICIIFTNNLTTTLSNTTPYKIQILSKIEEKVINKRNLQELPFKETKLMERPSSNIQMYSGNNEYSFYEKIKERENPITPSSFSLSEQRENFIRKISNLDNSKCFHNTRIEKNIVPYNLGNRQERREINLQRQIKDNTGSMILSDNSYLDSSSLNSFRNISDYYNNKNQLNSSNNDCFYLHMIIPNKILQMNNVFFSNEENAFWELGCKIFEFKQVIR